MDELPEEILEVIFSFLSPYKEYEIASCVCTKWHRIIDGLMKQLPRKFEENLTIGNIQWLKVNEGEQVTKVTPRKRQATCYNDHQRSMYVFGGMSLSRGPRTGFNDLLRLDLHSFTWHRPAVKGNIPPPKYGCSICSYKHFLILFGGSLLASSNTLHRFYNEYNNDLHVYDTKTGVWSRKSFLPNECPPMLFLPQTCLITDDVDSDIDVMIVYGGQTSGMLHHNKEVWSLNLSTWTWFKQSVICTKSNNIIMDTSKATFFPIKSSLYSSAIIVLSQCAVNFIAWLLYKTGFAEWTSKDLKITTPDYIPVLLMHECMPWTQIGDTLILFGKSCDPSVMPELSSISKPKTLQGGKELPSTKLKPGSHQVQRMSRFQQERAAFQPFAHQRPNNLKQELSFPYMLNLKYIETEGLVEWVNQQDNDNKVFSSKFIGLGIGSNSTAVMGRGEIILHGVSYPEQQASMSLFVIRSKM